ncbi:MAG TPA: hypothetical protein VH420_09990 [Gaiellaceae bacterium]|jgi:hypothetical protein
MSVLNKRNALLGWAVWTVSKRVAKQKAKSAASVDGSRWPGKRAIAATAAAIGGTVFFLRRRASDDDS